MSDTTDEPGGVADDHGLLAQGNGQLSATAHDVLRCPDVERDLLAYALSILLVELPVSAETGIVDQAGHVQATSFDFCGEDRTDRRLAEVQCDRLDAYAEPRR